MEQRRHARRVHIVRRPDRVDERGETLFTRRIVCALSRALVRWRAGAIVQPYPAISSTSSVGAAQRVRARSVMPERPKAP
jgi:hypothetical protein